MYQITFYSKGQDLLYGKNMYQEKTDLASQSHYFSNINLKTISTDL